MSNSKNLQLKTQTQTQKLQSIASSCWKLFFLIVSEDLFKCLCSDLWEKSKQALPSIP